jgi:glycosyltransferase involved in cell wall biosynthesis
MQLVSIIVPAKNQENYIAATIQSLIAQDYSELEILIIDDKSTDRTRKIAEAFNDSRIRILDGPGKGFVQSLNTGLFNANGELVMQCDADDIYPPGRISKQVAWLATHPEFDAVCGAYYSMDTQGKIISRLAHFPDEEEISHELCQGITRTSLCTFAIRREAVDNDGGLRDYFPTSGDIDFQLRFGEKHRVWYLPIFFYYYRIHNASITHSQPTPTREFFESTARLFQRQRQQNGVDDLMAGTPPTPPDGQALVNAASLHIAGLLTGEAWRLHRDGKKKEAINKALQLIQDNPLDCSRWKQCVLILLKKTPSPPKL